MFDLHTVYTTLACPYPYRIALYRDFRLYASFVALYSEEPSRCFSVITRPAAIHVAAIDARQVIGQSERNSDKMTYPIRVRKATCLSPTSNATMRFFSTAVKIALAGCSGSNGQSRIAPSDPPVA